MTLPLGVAGEVDGLSVGVDDELWPEEGVCDGGRLIRGEEGEEGEELVGFGEFGELGEGESRGEGTGDGVVAGTVVPVLSGTSEATAAPVPEKTRQAPTARATIRRLRARSPRSVMNEGGAERARDCPTAAASLNTDLSGSWDSDTGPLLGTRILQTMRERGPAPGQMRLDGAGRQTGLRGDLSDGQIADVVQRQRAALLGRQLPQRLHQGHRLRPGRLRMGRRPAALPGIRRPPPPPPPAHRQPPGDRTDPRLGLPVTVELTPCGSSP